MTKESVKKGVLEEMEKEGYLDRQHKVIRIGMVHEEVLKRAIDRTYDKCKKERHYIHGETMKKIRKIAKEQARKECKNQIKEWKDAYHDECRRHTENIDNTLSSLETEITKERNKSIKDYQSDKISKEVHISQINLLTRLDKALKTCRWPRGGKG